MGKSRFPPGFASPVRLLKMCIERDKSTSGSNYSGNDLTVIVGAGVMGLSIAYHLALEDVKASRKPSIMVLDVLDNVFGAASSTNSGCLNPSELHEDLKELGQYSFEHYQSLASDHPTFKDLTGFREESLFTVTEGQGRGQKSLPSWIRSDGVWDTSMEPPSGESATLNPKALGKWLKQQCLKMEVNIRTATRIISVQLSPDNTVHSVNVQEKNQGPETLPATRLVLSTGPWTEGLFAELFPRSSLQLGFTPVAGDYVILESPGPLRGNSLAGVFFDNIVGHKLEFIGRNDKTIWVCAQKSHGVELPKPCQLAEPDPNMINELKSYSQQFLDIGHDDNFDEKAEPRILECGRGFRPSTYAGYPVMGAVRGNHMHDPSTYSDNTLNSGIFICSGHGSHGILLGIGAGKVMSDLIAGWDPDIDVSKFGVDARLLHKESQS